MIERILDNYYTKKLIQRLKFTSISYYLDFKYIYEKDRVLVQCKNKKYNDKLYKTIFCIIKKESILYLCDYVNLRTQFNEIIKDYIEENK